MGRFCFQLLVVGFWLAFAVAAKAQAIPLRGYLAAHDPSTIIQCKNRYYLFYTAQGIASKSSADKVFWSAGPAVFSSSPAWTTNLVPGFSGTIWAPDVLFFNSQYYLYYAVSTFGSQVSAIGLATSPTLDPTDPTYLWTDRGAVITSTNGAPYNVIDPSFCWDTSGHLWMAFGSYWNGIYLTQLNTTNGLRIAANSPVYHLAYNSSIEASYIWHRGSYYYLFVNYGSCCSGVNSTYNIRMGRSTSITGPYRDRNGVDMAGNGGSVFLRGTGKFCGPGHVGITSTNGVDTLSYHYYDANAWSSGYNAYGAADFDVVPLSWTADNWPVYDLDWSAIYDFQDSACDKNGQYSGLLQGGATIQVDPTYEHVLNLNGTNQYVWLPPGAANGQTFIATVKWRGGNPWQRIFDFGVDTTKFFMLTPASGDNVLRCDLSAGSGVQTLQWTKPLPSNVWTQVAITLDGTRGILYVNGSAVATNASMSLPLNVQSETNHLGRSKFIADAYFNGQFANFKVYGHVLTAKEILAQTTATSVSVTNSSSNYWSSYPLRSDVKDLNGYYNGTLKGGASFVNDTNRGNVLNLSGSSQYVTFPAGVSGLETFSGWVKWSGGNAWQRVFDFGVNNNRFFFLTPADGARLPQVAITSDASHYTRVLESSVGFPTGQWTHVAIVMNGREGVFYLNGAVVAVNNSVNLLPTDIAGSASYLGKSQFTADPYFNGRLSSLYFNSSALTLNQIISSSTPLTATLDAASHNGVLSWPSWVVPMQLYNATNLNSPVNWQLVTNPPTLTNATMRLQLPLKPQNNFFRLKLAQ